MALIIAENKKAKIKTLDFSKVVFESRTYDEMTIEFLPNGLVADFGCGLSAKFLTDTKRQYFELVSVVNKSINNEDFEVQKKNHYNYIKIRCE